MAVTHYFKSKCTTMSQRWVICALCSYALAFFAVRRRIFSENFDAINFLAHELPIDGSITCPFYYSNCIFKNSPKGLLPYTVPDLFHLSDIQDLSDQIFLAGRAMMALPAGKAADLGWTREVLGLAVFTQAVISLLMPITSELGPSWFLLKHLLEGAANGALFPCLISLISRWSPTVERNTFTVFILAGKYYGDMLGHVLFALVWTQILSWNCSMYSLGALGLVWIPLWLIFGYNSPLESPFVSATECYNIIHHRGRRQSMRSRASWTKIVTSLPFLSLIAAFTASDWVVLMIVDGNLDPYLTQVLHHSMKMVTRTSIIAIAGMPSSLIGGLLADWMVRNELISNTVTKRVYIMIGVVGPSLLFMMIPLSGCKWAVFATMYTTAIYLISLPDSALYSCPVDLQPGHAGLMMGVIIMIRSFFSLFNYQFESVIYPDVEGIKDWLEKFWWCFVLSIVLIIPFMVFGSGEKQPWYKRSSGVSVPLTQPALGGLQNDNKSGELKAIAKDQQRS